MSKSKSIKKKLDKKTYCKNHPKRKASGFCERCHEPYCEECIKEVWQSNFTSAAFLASKDLFTSDFLCSSCERSQRIKRVAWASFLLIIFLVSMLAVSFGSIFSN
ncbi:MAG: B-box zinc finger protein [Candidatus Hodarchaeales archaeon]